MNLTATEIGAAYRAWWAASYPNSPPSAQSVANVIAFIQHLQRQPDA